MGGWNGLAAGLEGGLSRAGWTGAGVGVGVGAGDKGTVFVASAVKIVEKNTKA